VNLLNLLPHEDIGWKEINETFIRYTLLKTRWFRVYVHRLTAVQAHEACHNHPWSFIAFVLKGGYNEFTKDTGWVWRGPGSVLRRPAAWSHNVTTKSEGMWSLVITGPKAHEWSFQKC
jgi:hypothetical protein